MERNHTEDDKGKTITAETFDELREGILKYRRVALIDDPNALERATDNFLSAFG